ncbi:hypothetical protein SAMN05443247_06429 [Bradyrhizobium erythrophlei]|nr:hypothetical protein SAMN05443247_06429 [Bradyrhizobium erythrophlei]
MTEMNTKQRYALRLLARFVDYAPDRGQHLWREFSKDKIVTDPDEISLLEKLGAPIERIDAANEGLMGR